MELLFISNLLRPIGKAVAALFEEKPQIKMNYTASSSDPRCSDFKNIGIGYIPFNEYYNLRYQEPPSCSTFFRKNAVSGKKFVAEIEQTPEKIKNKCSGVIFNMTQPYAYSVWQEMPVVSYNGPDQLELLECYGVELTSNMIKRSTFVDCINPILYQPINEHNDAFNRCEWVSMAEIAVLSVGSVFFLYAAYKTYKNYNQICTAFSQLGTRARVFLSNLNLNLVLVPNNRRRNSEVLTINLDTQSSDINRRNLLSPTPTE
jgi:hypothetical protein